MVAVETRTSVKALLRCGDEILVVRRAKENGSGKYHFPGGCLHPGESVKDGLRREIEEETGISEIEIGQQFFEYEWQVSLGVQVCRVIGKFFRCKTNQREISLSDEHDYALWIPPANHITLPMVYHGGHIIDRYIELE